MALGILPALIFTVLICLQCTVPVHSQVVVDNKICQKFRLGCGTSTSQKYCCAEGNGALPIYSCCNPYTGLFIGIGVSVPIIVLLIILCCVLYFVYARYRRRKMQALFRIYQRRSQRERSSTNFVAPPPYTPLADEGEPQPLESELPAYSETDQFAIALTVTRSPPPAQETPIDEQNVTSESTAQDSVVVESSETPLDDVPLLSDDQS